VESTAIIYRGSGYLNVINQIMQFCGVIAIIIVTVDVPIGVFDGIHVQSILGVNTTSKHTDQANNRG
jgi:hypothetical protein